MSTARPTFCCSFVCQATGKGRFSVVHRSALALHRPASDNSDHRSLVTKWSQAEMLTIPVFAGEERHRHITISSTVRSEMNLGREYPCNQVCDGWDVVPAIRMVGATSRRRNQPWSCAMTSVCVTWPRCWMSIGQRSLVSAGIFISIQASNACRTTCSIAFGPNPERRTIPPSDPGSFCTQA